MRACLAVGVKLAREDERRVGVESGGVRRGDGPENHRSKRRRGLGVLAQEAASADPLRRIVQALEAGDAVRDGFDFQAIIVTIFPPVANAPLGRCHRQAVVSAD